LARPTKFISFIVQWPLPTVLCVQGDPADGVTGPRWRDSIRGKCFFSHCSPCMGLVAAPDCIVLRVTKMANNIVKKIVAWLFLLMAIFFFEGIWGLCCSILVMSMRNTNRGLEKERMSRELIFLTRIYRHVTYPCLTYEGGLPLVPSIG